MQQVTAKSFARQFIAIILLGLGLTYMGVTRSATAQFEQYGSLQRVQVSRLDLARSAESGFGTRRGVSTTTGALSTIPLGLLYLFFAPFPVADCFVASKHHPAGNGRLVGFVSLLILGFWFTIKYRLRMISPILIFTVMLTFAYSVFRERGNCISPAGAAARVLLYLRGRGLCADAGETGRAQTATD